MIAFEAWIPRLGHLKPAVSLVVACYHTSDRTERKLDYAALDGWLLYGFTPWSLLLVWSTYHACHAYHYFFNPPFSFLLFLLFFPWTIKSISKSGFSSNSSTYRLGWETVGIHCTRRVITGWFRYPGAIRILFFFFSSLFLPTPICLAVPGHFRSFLLLFYETTDCPWSQPFFFFSLSLPLNQLLLLTSRPHSRPMWLAAQPRTAWRRTWFPTAITCHEHFSFFLCDSTLFKTPSNFDNPRLAFLSLLKTGEPLHIHYSIPPYLELCLVPAFQHTLLFNRIGTFCCTIWSTIPLSLPPFRSPTLVDFMHPQLRSRHSQTRVHGGNVFLSLITCNFFLQRIRP